VRVLYLLFLLPLTAVASCPSGIKLSNVSISTALPYCVKFESSTLGGCEVACPGVCVEFPNNGTKGPIETTGNECKLGGDGGTGGDGDGGDDGGTGGDNSSLSTKRIYPQLVGETHTADLSVGFNALFDETYVMKNKLSQIASGTHSFEITSRQMLKQLQDIKYNTSRDDNAVSQAVGESNFYLKSIVDKLDFEDVPATPDGHLDGKFGELFGRMDRDYFGGTVNIAARSADTAMYTAQMASQLGSNGVNGHLMDIKGILESGSSGGNGTGQGNDIDYSKMPGSSNNPLEVAKSEYQSSCQGTNCYFDVSAVEKEYKDKQKELTDKYKEIKEDATKVFDYSLSGTAEVPKCFELYSFNGQTYSICPDASGYWETLAALLLFMFYIVALMIIFRR
jgi:hypothetical protein